MKLTWESWNEKACAYLEKLRKTFGQRITNELNEQRPNEPENQEKRQTNPASGECDYTEARDSAIPDKYTDLLNHARAIFLEPKEQGFKKR